MGRPRNRLPWHYDDQRQEFTTDAGYRVTLHELAQLSYDVRRNRIDLVGPWQGWRLRGPRLHPPRAYGNITMKPEVLGQFLTWLKIQSRYSTQRPIGYAPNATDGSSDRTELRIRGAVDADDIPADALHIIGELVAGSLGRLLRSP